MEQHAAMTWAQRLKRVFNIDITTCEECGGAVKVIPKAFAAAKAFAALMGWAPLTGQALASIEDPAVIKQILAHLRIGSPF